MAEGVETWSDFLAVREIGFDLVQGFLFAKPMSAQKFVQTCWATSQGCPPAPQSSYRGELGFIGAAGSLLHQRGQTESIPRGLK